MPYRLFVTRVNSALNSHDVSEKTQDFLRHHFEITVRVLTGEIGNSLRQLFDRNFAEAGFDVSQTFIDKSRIVTPFFDKVTMDQFPLRITYAVFSIRYLERERSKQIE